MRGFRLQVVLVCFVKLVVEGYSFSAQFDLGGPWEGKAPQLQRGWIAGRSVVRG